MQRITRLFCALMLIVFGLSAGQATASHDDSYVVTWTAANKVASPFDAPPPAFSDVTLRHIVRVSAGGSRLRVWLTNEFGNAPLLIGAASVAVRNADYSVNAASLRQLSFGNATSIVIPAGARVLSDSVNLGVHAFTDLAISMYVPAGGAVSTSPVSYHVRAL